MLSKKFLFALMIGACTITFGMDDSREHGLPSQMLPIASTQELDTYNKELLKACEKRDYNSIFRLTIPGRSITYDITPPDQEIYLYNRTYALSITYFELAKRFSASPHLAIQNYTKLIKECDDYTEKYGINSETKEPHVVMLEHLVNIYDKVGHAFFLIAKLQNPHQISPRPLDIFKRSYVAYKQALAYRERIACKLPEINMSSLPDPHYQLVFLYCIFAQFDFSSGNLSRENLKKAKASYGAIEPSLWTAGELETAKNLITVTETFFEQANHSIPSTLKKIQTARDQKYCNDVNKILGKEKEKNKNDTLVGIIRNKHTYLETLNLSVSNRSDYQEVAEKIKESLVDIEETVSESLALKPSSTVSIGDTTFSSPSEERLKTIYMKLNEFLGYETMINAFWKYIAAFMITNDLDGGIHRANLLKEIEVKQHGDASYRIRYIVAAIKNLQGDHDEWLSLEAEYQEQERQKKEKKKARKKEIRDQTMESLRLSLAQQPKKKEELSTPKKVPLPTKTSLKDKLQDPEHGSAVVEGIGGSLKQEKIDKQKRHEEATAKKQQDGGMPKANQKQKDSLLNVRTPPISKEAQKETELKHILISSDKTLRELYDLSSTPLRVDEEIEQERWGFTREEFKLYVEAMGCAYKDGRGIHTKASLPRAIHIMQGDNLVTILNDFGGALILPLWDKNYVPDYLKPQILKAREKLRAFAINALNYQQQFPQ